VLLLDCQETNFVNKLRPQSIRNYFVEINVNKATAFDGVSVKIMKIAKPVIVKPITKLINKSISYELLVCSPLEEL
jgi:hypothetical protein